VSVAGPPGILAGSTGRESRVKCGKVSVKRHKSAHLVLVLRLQEPCVIHMSHHMQQCVLLQRCMPMEQLTRVWHKGMVQAVLCDYISDRCISRKVLPPCQPRRMAGV